MASPRRISHAVTRAFAVVGWLSSTWLALAVVGAAWDIAAMQPHRGPTPAERAAATPAARAQWAKVYATLYRRLPRPPPELGPVWRTWSGRICGAVNTREAGVDFMTPFYTDAGRVWLREDDFRRYDRAWPTCLGDQWVILNPGVFDTGMCASAHVRKTVLGREICGPASR
jgi:hypothetical protein